MDRPAAPRPTAPRPTASGRRRRGLPLLLLAAASALAGFGAQSFRYAEGGSYVSEDPRTCVNCHIMQRQFDSWQKASHHAVATCNDCHLPHAGLAKWIAKVRNGWNHSKAFTLQDFPEPIRLTEGNAAILQANCVRCHGDFVHEVLTEPGPRSESLRCIHCHRSAGHGESVGLGGPRRPGERPEEMR
jgi:cytochrome c nitrite reductase small subunit